jgi:hypothetical protein
MSVLIWKKRKCKIPGLVGGYTTVIDGTEIWVKEDRQYPLGDTFASDAWKGTGRWNWNFNLFVHGGPCNSIEEAKVQAIELFAKLTKKEAKKR